MSVIDARVPVTFLNLAWHRLEWPPIETFAGEVDVVHSMHPLLMPAQRAAQVVTVHDLYFLDAPENTSAEIRRDYPPLAGSHARRADAVVTVSEYTASLVRSQLGADGDRVTICPNGAPAWAPIERRGSASGSHVLFMGTIEPRKNVQTLLRAYAELLARNPDAPPLVLAGRLAPACQPLLDELARPPLAGRVRHLGYVSGAERERLYREASMVVLPSLDEGFGLPALEAMTIGVPVVVSSRGALPEVVGRAGLIVDADDVAGLAAAMDRILNDPALAQRCSAAGIDAGPAVQLGRQRGALDASLCVGGRKAPIALVTRPLAIGIDARELLGEATGVGRYLAELLVRWTARSDAARRRFVLYSPEPLPLSFPTGTVDAAFGRHRRGTRHVVGADASAESRQPRLARRLLRARLHRSTRDRLCRWPSPSTTSRLSRIPSGSARGRASAAGGSPAEPLTPRLSCSPTRSSPARSSRRASRRHVAHRRDSAGSHRPPQACARGKRRESRWCSSSDRSSTGGGCPDLIAAFALATQRSPGCATHHRRGRPHVAAPGSGRGGGRARRSVENRVPALRSRRRARRALRARLGVRLPLGVRRLRHDAARGAVGWRAAGRARHCGRAGGVWGRGRLRGPRRHRRHGQRRSAGCWWSLRARRRFSHPAGPSSAGIRGTPPQIARSSTSRGSRRGTRGDDPLHHHRQLQRA